jgi:molybdate transport repressor ModE-like protein
MNAPQVSEKTPNGLEILIERYRSDEGKLSCSNSFKIARKLKLEPIDVGNKAKELGVRISACDLGQFGSQPMGELKHEVLSDLEGICDSQKRVYCHAARELAKKSNLKHVRTAIKRGEMDVLYCQLGCFTAKKRTRLYVKSKTWIENQDKTRLFGKGKTELLELIAEYGSLSQAAEILGMTVQKAWSHIEELRKNLDDVLVHGSQEWSTEEISLTPVAQEFIINYRKLQDEIEAFANSRFKELFLKPRNKREFGTK